MKRSIRVSGILATALLIALVGAVAAQQFKTDLTGYEETPLTINSDASGKFTAKGGRLKGVGTEMDYQLPYQELSPAAQPPAIRPRRPAHAAALGPLCC